MSTTDCQGFVQKLLKYNIFEGKYSLVKEGKVAVHYQLCLFKVTLTWGIEFRPTKSSQGLGICFPGRLISKKEEVRQAFNVNHLSPQSSQICLSGHGWGPDISRLIIKHQEWRQKQKKKQKKTPFGCKSRTAKLAITEHLLSVCCGHPCWMPSPNSFPAAPLLIGSCSYSSNHSFPTHTM